MPKRSRRKCDGSVFFEFRLLTFLWTRDTIEARKAAPLPLLPKTLYFCEIEDLK